MGCDENVTRTWGKFWISTLHDGSFRTANRATAFPRPPSSDEPPLVIVATARVTMC